MHDQCHCNYSCILHVLHAYLCSVNWTTCICVLAVGFLCVYVDDCYWALAAEPIGHRTGGRPLTFCAQRYCLPYHFSASKLTFLPFRVEDLKAMNASIAMSFFKPWQNSTFSEKVSSASGRLRPRPPSGSLPWTPVQAWSQILTLAVPL